MRQSSKHFATTDGSDALAYVLSLNLRGRHVNESQRAMVAARLANMPRGGDQRSDQSANLRIGPTAQQAATLLNVGTRSVENGRKVLNDGAPDLVKAVDQGKIAVSVAAGLLITGA